MFKIPLKSQEKRKRKKGNTLNYQNDENAS